MTKRSWLQRYGGYANEFRDPLPDECPCQVCTLVQRDPHQVMCCGKIFCKSCLDELVENEHCCPNCRSNFTKEKKFFPDLNAERKIKHLTVYCKNKKNGCNWSGHLKDLKTHIQKCPNQMVRCTNARHYRWTWSTWCGNLIENYCGAEVQRHQLKQHMTQECKWRMAKCVHCDTSDTHHFITGEHIDECPNIEVPCTYKDCKVTVKRKLLDDHRKECPKAKIPCQYSSVGCTARVAREEMKTHNQEHMEEHLNKTVKILNKTVKVLDEVTKRLVALEDEKK